MISGFLENAQMDISYKLMKGANRYAIEHDMYAANLKYVLRHNHKKLVLMYGHKEAEVAHERYKGFTMQLKGTGIR